MPLSFVSTGVEKQGETYLLKGDLTMRGVTKSITVPVKVLGVLDSKDFGKKAGFSSTFTINRKDYGINWNKALDQGGYLLSDEVKVSVNLEVNKVAPAAPAAAPAK